LQQVLYFFFILKGCGDNKCRVFSYDGVKNEYKLLKEIEAHESDINCVKFHPKIENVLATSSDDYNIKFWKF
jgi:WD40 repeat protein